LRLFRDAGANATFGPFWPPIGPTTDFRAIPVPDFEMHHCLTDHLAKHPQILVAPQLPALLILILEAYQIFSCRQHRVHGASRSFSAIL
jgi:hypothetical protein